MTDTARMFRKVLADRGAAEATTNEANMIVERAHDSVARYKSTLGGIHIKQDNCEISVVYFETSHPRATVRK